MGVSRSYTGKVGLGSYISGSDDTWVRKDYKSGGPVESFQVERVFLRLYGIYHAEDVTFGKPLIGHGEPCGRIAILVFSGLSRPYLLLAAVFALLSF